MKQLPAVTRKGWFAPQDLFVSFILASLMFMQALAQSPEDFRLTHVVELSPQTGFALQPYYATTANNTRLWLTVAHQTSPNSGCSLWRYDPLALPEQSWLLHDTLPPYTTSLEPTVCRLIAINEITTHLWMGYGQASGDPGSGITHVHGFDGVGFINRQPFQQNIPGYNIQEVTPLWVDDAQILLVFLLLMPEGATSSIPVVWYQWYPMQQQYEQSGFIELQRARGLHTQLYLSGEAFALYSAEPNHVLQWETSSQQMVDVGASLPDDTDYLSGIDWSLTNRSLNHSHSNTKINTQSCALSADNNRGVELLCLNRNNLLWESHGVISSLAADRALSFSGSRSGWIVHTGSAGTFVSQCAEGLPVQCQTGFGSEPGIRLDIVSPGLGVMDVAQFVVVHPVNPSTQSLSFYQEVTGTAPTPTPDPDDGGGGDDNIAAFVGGAIVFGALMICGCVAYCRRRRADGQGSTWRFGNNGSPYSIFEDTSGGGSSSIQGRGPPGGDASSFLSPRMSNRGTPNSKIVAGAVNARLQQNMGRCSALNCQNPPLGKYMENGVYIPYCNDHACATLECARLKCGERKYCLGCLATQRAQVVGTYGASLCKGYSVLQCPNLAAMDKQHCVDCQREIQAEERRQKEQVEKL